MGRYDDEDLSLATDDELREARGLADELERQMRASKPEGTAPDVYEMLIRRQRRSVWEGALAVRIRNRRAVAAEFGEELSGDPNG